MVIGVNKCVLPPVILNVIFAYNFAVILESENARSGREEKIYLSKEMRVNTKNKKKILWPEATKGGGAHDRGRIEKKQTR